MGGPGVLVLVIASALLLALIHPSAQKRNSANFVCTEFSEVGFGVSLRVDIPERLGQIAQKSLI
jgi:hypothetical protein